MRRGVLEVGLRDWQESNTPRDAKKNERRFREGDTRVVEITLSELVYSKGRVLLGRVGERWWKKGGGRDRKWEQIGEASSPSLTGATRKN